MMCGSLLFAFLHAFRCISVHKRHKSAHDVPSWFCIRAHALLSARLVP